MRIAESNDKINFQIYMQGGPREIFEYLADFQ